MELPDRELTELRALAARRGMRGFSEIVAEAVREYLRCPSSGGQTPAQGHRPPSWFPLQRGGGAHAGDRARRPRGEGLKADLSIAGVCLAERLPLTRNRVEFERGRSLRFA